MAQQTAVEWLQESSLHILTHEQQTQVDGLFQQAKQMETEQIIEAYRVGVEEDVYNNPLRTGQEYYNDIYTTNK